MNDESLDNTTFPAPVVYRLQSQVKFLQDRVAALERAVGVLAEECADVRAGTHLNIEGFHIRAERLRDATNANPVASAALFAAARCAP